MSWKLLVVSMLALASGACGSTPSDGADDTESSAEALSHAGALARVPMRIDYLNGDISFVVKVKIGGTTVDAEVDTGSTGLRVAADLLQDGDLASVTDTPVPYSYASGTALHGVVATAYVTIGGVSTPNPIAIERIDSVGCVDSIPNCPANGVALADFAFKAKAGGTPRAILGLGMRNPPDGIASPISQMKNHPAFIVDIPSGYGAAHGQLRIGPTKAERKTFSNRALLDMPNANTPPDGVPAKDDRAQPVCVTNDTTALSYCAPTLFDTGNGPISVSSTAATNPHAMAAGSNVEVFYIADDGEAFRYSFAVGDPPTTGLDQVVVAPASNDSINIGTSVFFHNKVLFDQTRGLIGVHPY